MFRRNREDQVGRVARFTADDIMQTEVGATAGYRWVPGAAPMNPYISAAERAMMTMAPAHRRIVPYHVRELAGAAAEQVGVMMGHWLPGGPGAPGPTGAARALQTMAVRKTYVPFGHWPHLSYVHIR